MSVRMENVAPPRKMNYKMMVSAMLNDNLPAIFFISRYYFVPSLSLVLSLSLSRSPYFSLSLFLSLDLERQRWRVRMLLAAIRRRLLCAAPLKRRSRARARERVLTWRATTTRVSQSCVRILSVSPFRRVTCYIRCSA